MPRSLFCCHSIWIFFVCKASFYNSWTDLLYNIWIFFKPLPYFLQRVCSLFWFYFNSTLRLITCSILDCSFSKSFLLILLQSCSSKFELILFALSFHNLVLTKLLLLLLLLIVLSLILFILSCSKLRRG